jgi:hypothetical protein
MTLKENSHQFIPQVCIAPEINFDGLYSYQSASDGKVSRSYFQFFRNGIIESVETLLLSGLPMLGDQDKIPSFMFEDEIHKFVNRALKLMSEVGINTPVYCFISLLNVQDKTFSGGDRRWPNETKNIKQKDLFLPEIILNNFDCDIRKELKRATDLVWNAVGIDESENYDSKGEWIK